MAGIDTFSFKSKTDLDVHHPNEQLVLGAFTVHKFLEYIISAKRLKTDASQTERIVPDSVNDTVWRSGLLTSIILLVVK